MVIGHLCHMVTKKLAQYYQYNAFTKLEVAPILQEVHDHADHFRSKIVLEHFRFQIAYPKMGVDIQGYI